MQRFQYRQLAFGDPLVVDVMRRPQIFEYSLEVGSFHHRARLLTTGVIGHRLRIDIHDVEKDTMGGTVR